MKKTFTKYKSTFKLLKSIGLWAIYERSFDENGSLSWEVVKYYKHPTGKMNYPGSSMWGTYGFTYNDFGKAESKFQQMTADQ